jgi:hypothetical protein
MREIALYPSGAMEVSVENWRSQDACLLNNRLEPVISELIPAFHGVAQKRREVHSL